MQNMTTKPKTIRLSSTSQSGARFLKWALFWSIWAWCSLSYSTVFAQARDVARQVVDIVLFKNQKPIRGIILDETPMGGITMAVSMKWLKQENADAYSKAIEAAEKEAVQARLQFRDRLRNLADPQTGALGFVISKELERVESELENAPQEYSFLLMRFKSANVTSRKLASDGHRKIAVWSWHEGLKEVETRAPASLQEELKSNGIDFDSMPPSLADRFYPTQESDDQWTVRMAIVSHRLGKAIEYQGTGDLMVAVDGEQPPDLGVLMGKMMQSQMNSLLQELTNAGKKARGKGQEGTQWIKAAIAQADKERAPFFRATQVAMDSLQGTATVESVFMAKLNNGNWTVAWKSAATENTADQTQEAVERISEDPQILEIRKQLELFGAASISLDSAIRMGTATKSALGLVNDEFQRYSERYLKRLNSPPIPASAK